MRILPICASLVAAFLYQAPAAAQGPPAAPTNLTAAVISATRIDLSWQDNSSNETGFVLLRKTGAGLYSRLAVLGPDVTGHADTSVRPGTTYSYITRAINGAGVSAWSNEPSVTTPAEPPWSPGNLTATPTAAHQIDLRWQDRSQNETGFALLRRIGTGPYGRVAILDPDTTGYADKTVGPNTAYTYILRALVDGRPITWSNEASTTIPGGPPAAPAILSATSPTDRVDVVWRDNSNNEAGFVLLRRSWNGAYSRVAVLGPNTTRYNDTTATAPNQYTYIMRAINDFGASPWSNEAPAPSPPRRPSSLIAGALSDTEISLTWADESQNEAGFDIWRKSSQGEWVSIGTVAANVSVFLDQGLVPNAIYLYRVRARHSGGFSEWSNEAVGVPVGLPWITHAAPSVVSGGSDTTRVTLEFALPAEYTRFGTWIRSHDSRGQTMEFLPTYLTQQEPQGSGYRDFNSGNYPPDTYLVRAEMLYTRPDGLMTAVVSPWTSLQVPAATLASLSVPPTVQGGASVMATVQLTRLPLGGNGVVTLTSSNPAVAQVPASVTVPSWTASASFTITTTAVTTSTPVTVTASYGGVTREAPLTAVAP